MAKTLALLKGQSTGWHLRRSTASGSSAAGLARKNWLLLDDTKSMAGINIYTGSVDSLIDRIGLSG
ncbi:hypothetical protein [Pseudomonas prosekii]|uniref:hypothetical protein n=1 Tax=Pseudomonas prosekii TaxID=1148509 RepID=UPI003F74F2B6